jgi:amino-acid N-acetyltransferase
MEIVWSDLAEIKSLAVAENKKGSGIGKALVLAVADEARSLGLPKLFALTLKPDFFKKLGFEQVDRNKLPMKVWSDCARCPKQDHCDEVAMILQL